MSQFLSNHILGLVYDIYYFNSNFLLFLRRFINSFILTKYIIYNIFLVFITCIAYLVCSFNESYIFSHLFIACEVRLYTLSQAKEMNQ
jgi:hypothetical protein